VPKEIVLPALAADFEGGVIEEWHKQVGDRIEVGDVIAEVSTDKAIVELEAEDAGVLGRILAPAGPDEVPVNSTIALLLLDGETPDALEAFGAAADVAPPVAAGAETARPVAAVVAEPGDAAGVPVDDSGRVFASPVALRIAQQLGVDLASVEGSGPGGRIVLGDVEAAAARQDLPMRPAAVAAPAPSELPPPGTYTAVPVDKVRRVIARRLADAKRAIPHFYLSIDCAMDALLDLRRRYNDDADAAARLSVNDFLVKASALALVEVPDVNAGWSDEALLKFNDVNVAVAVASPKGLVTPVVRNANTKSLSTIAREIRELAARAQEGRLKPEEYKGGGFTLSNLGMYGVREFSAIINPPQSCILAVGAAEPRAVVRDARVAVATMMSCTLSVDHRAVDGALGAEFLQAFRQLVEQPERLFD